MKLTIAIPTYNRAHRLERALLHLMSEINSSRYKKDVAVYVSNNGSTDSTADVVAQSSKTFLENGIPFSSRIAECNQGFDANVLSLYTGSSSEYIWFLSDDDNIISGSIDTIIDDAIRYSPKVIYYNFDQEPFTKTRPYITAHQYFSQITESNIVALQKITKWPKLSALVIKQCAIGLQVQNLDSGFAHVMLALQCGLSAGGVLHSPVFTAYPDSDYKDHINFAPHISNSIDLPIRVILQNNNMMSLYKQLSVPYVDPLVSSLNTLGAYYRGQHTLTVSLKQELWTTVRDEIGRGWIKRSSYWKLVREIIKFPVSLVFGLGRTLIARKIVDKH